MPQKIKIDYPFWKQLEKFIDEKASQPPGNIPIFFNKLESKK